MIALGAMSGTSTDGVDVAALHLPEGGTIRYLGMVSVPFDTSLQTDLLRLQRLPAQFDANEDPLLMMLQARQSLTQVYAQAAQVLLTELGLDSSDVQVLGAHGQTLRHRPELGFTYQMLNAAQLATTVGIDVVHDFRSKDVALGGQGAPLVPAFHRAWLAQKGIRQRAAVLNLGGFSNLTLLGEGDFSVRGGDCGPANCLMDAWAMRRYQQTMDHDGLIAASGRVNQALFRTLWAHPFFSKTWPKSTGRDDFTMDWLDTCLGAVDGDLPDEDVMATLLALGVSAVAACLPPGTERVYVCGGGANNTALMSALAQSCASATFSRIEDLGLPAQAVEACAFAWMAAQAALGASSNCTEVTGASRSTILGSIQRFS